MIETEHHLSKIFNNMREKIQTIKLINYPPSELRIRSFLALIELIDSSVTERKK